MPYVSVCHARRMRSARLDYQADVSLFESFVASINLARCFNEPVKSIPPLGIVSVSRVSSGDLREARLRQIREWHPGRIERQRRVCQRSVELQYSFEDACRGRRDAAPWCATFDLPERVRRGAAFQFGERKADVLS
jgi:hypothetical protein